MSYSGEWIYSNQNNPRKKSVTASEMVRQSLTPQVSIQRKIEIRFASDEISFDIDSNGISSSDTETEDVASRSNQNRPSYQRTRSNQTNSNNSLNRMLVQTSTDEQKLNSIKQNTQRPTYPLTTSEPIRQLSSFSNAHPGGSSDDIDSLYDQSTNYTDRTSSPSVQLSTNTNERRQERDSSVPQSVESLSTIQNQTDHINDNDFNKRDVDCASVTSSEWGVESEKSESTSQRHKPSTKRKLHNDNKRCFFR